MTHSDDDDSGSKDWLARPDSASEGGSTREGGHTR